MNNWNGLDFFIFLIFVANTILGMARGATKEIVSMMCLSVALIFTIKFTIPLAAFFNSSPLINDVVDSTFTQNFMAAINAGPLTANLLTELFYSISLLICFVGAFSTCEAALFFTGFVEVFSFPYATLNRKVGAALGCTRGYIITLVFLSILTLHIFKNDNNLLSNNFFTNSFFVNLFQSTTKKLDDLISQQQPEKYNELYKNKNLYNEKDIYKIIKNNP